jgi:rSAM/selenodomain-associated transferase 2
VIGPAEDGGYWLLGVTAEAADRALSVLFEGIEWGGPDVFRQTMERASDAGLRVALAETLADVDRPEDIALWEIERAAEAEVPRSVTVVIPALDEAERVGDAVRSAIDGGADEVIVVDGGSRDLTRRVAEAAGAVVLESEPGRARQMNQGASAVTGDALVFLHADTRLPPGFAAAVRETLSLDGVSGGSFTWGTDDTPLAGLFNWVGRTRVTITHATYGDQGLFLRRSTFEDLGGYPDQPVMEDWELVRRLQRLGEFVVLPKRAMTSSRRYTERGVLSATAADIAVIAGYRLGMDPVRLDAWRRR